MAPPEADITSPQPGWEFLDAFEDHLLSPPREHNSIPGLVYWNTDVLVAGSTLCPEDEPLVGVNSGTLEIEWEADEGPTHSKKQRPPFEEDKLEEQLAQRLAAFASPAGQADLIASGSSWGPDECFDAGEWFSNGAGGASVDPSAPPLETAWDQHDDNNRDSAFLDSFFDLSLPLVASIPGQSSLSPSNPPPSLHLEPQSFYPASLHSIEAADDALLSFPPVQTSPDSSGRIRLQQSLLISLSPESPLPNSLRAEPSHRVPLSEGGPNQSPLEAYPVGDTTVRNSHDKECSAQSEDRQKGTSRLSLLAAALASAEAKARKKSGGPRSPLTDSSPVTPVARHAASSSADAYSRTYSSSVEVSQGPSNGLVAEACLEFEMRGGDFQNLSISNEPPAEEGKLQLSSLASKGNSKKKARLLTMTHLWIQRPLEQLSNPEFASYRAAYSVEVKELARWAGKHLGLQATAQQVAKAFWIACNGIPKPPLRHARLLVAKSRLWVEMMRSMLDSVPAADQFQVFQVVPQAYKEGRLDLLDSELSPNMSRMFRRMLQAMLDIQTDACRHLGSVKCEAERHISATVVDSLEARKAELQTLSSGRSHTLDEYLRFAQHYDGGPINLAVAFCSLLGRCDGKDWAPGEIKGMLRQTQGGAKLCCRVVCLSYDMRCYSKELLSGLKVNAVGLTMRDSCCNEEQAVLLLEKKAADLFVGMEKEIVASLISCPTLARCWQASFDLVRTALLKYAYGPYSNCPVKAMALFKP